MSLYMFLLLLIALILIGTSRLTGINRATVAIALAAIGWVIYVSWGADFVAVNHLPDYWKYLGGNSPTSETVKQFIHDNIFIVYVGHAASLALYLLATGTIVKILEQNGCLDFIVYLCRTASARQMLWRLVAVSFFISANLDNLTTTLLMLTVLRQLTDNRRERWLLGTAVVVAACMGGCFTVIGDPIGLLLWGQGAVTATAFSARLALPAVTACIIVTLMLSRKLPHRITGSRQVLPYRGNDTRLRPWQRTAMLFTALVGLWFVPTFYNITHLSPFLGAMCVLAILWVVNEAFNRRLFQADQMTTPYRHRAVILDSYAQLLYVLGWLLAMGVMKEAAVFDDLGHMLASLHMDGIWSIGILSGMLSSVTDSTAIAMCDVSLHGVLSHADLQHMAVNSNLWGSGSYMSQFLTDGDYWPVVVLCTTMGGLLLPIGNMSGLALMATEQLHPWWYIRHCTPALAIATCTAFIILFFENLLF